MKGGPRKTKKRKSKKTPTEEVTSDSVSFQAAEESNGVPGSDSAIISPSTASFSPSTPKRGRGQTRQTPEACLTSTPVTSKSLAGAKPVELECNELLKKCSVDSPCSKSKSQGRRGSVHASQPRQRGTKKQAQVCSKTNSPPAKCRRGRKQKIETGDLQTDTTTQRSRPRFELEKTDAAEQDESLLSSDLSVELSHHEEQLPSFSFQEDEESDDEEEELPSFLMQEDRKPQSITEGVFVWYKFRNYPFWPALVKSVNRKQKKASVMFIDDPLIQKKKG